MIIGDVDKFAVKIEAEAEIRLDGLQVCHFCYVIGGSEIGNFDFDAPEYEVYLEITNILLYKKYRNNKKLFCMNKHELISGIEEGLIHDRDAYASYVLTYYMRHGYPLNIGLWWQVYIVESGADARLLYYEATSPDNILETRVEVGYVDGVLQSCHDFMVSRLK